MNERIMKLLALFFFRRIDYENFELCANTEMIGEKIPCLRLELDFDREQDSFPIEVKLEMFKNIVDKRVIVKLTSTFHEFYGDYKHLKRLMRRNSDQFGYLFDVLWLLKELRKAKVYRMQEERL